MQCQLCDKQATVHLTEIVNGQKTERHLCEECAQDEGITIKGHIPLSEILDNVMSAQEVAQELSDLSCPQCDLKWADFRRHGLLGCPNDYLAFDTPLRRLIQQAQEGAERHLGRAPRRTARELSEQSKLLRLRRDLQQALQQENYEAAVRLRDEIAELTSE